MPGQTACPSGSLLRYQSVLSRFFLEKMWFSAAPPLAPSRACPLGVAESNRRGCSVVWPWRLAGSPDMPCSPDGSEARVIMRTPSSQGVFVTHPICLIEGVVPRVG